MTSTTYSLLIVWQVLRRCILPPLVFTLWLSAWALIPSTYAATVAGLYEAEVVVSDTSDSAREAGEHQALRAVLVKLTGLEEADLETKVLLSAVDMAAMVEQSQMRESTDGGSTRLWVSFDSTSIDGLLARNGLSVWPRTRPRTILLVAIEEDGVRRMMAADDASGLPQALRTAAKRRGLPIVLPLMDLRDQQTLRVADVWGGFDTQLRQAGTRYRAEAMISARLVRQGVGLFDADWTVTLGQISRNWTQQDLSAGALADALVGSAVKEMMAVFADISSAPDTTVGGDLLLSVRGVDSPSAYGKVLNYLRALDLVEAVAVLEVTSGEILFALSTSAGASAVQRLVAIGDTLIFVRQGEVAEYRLLR